MIDSGWGQSEPVIGTSIYKSFHLALFILDTDWVLDLQTGHMVSPSGTEGLMAESKCEERESDKG